MARGKRETSDRTFNIYAKTDCVHANGLHDYLKYLKYGYGRATDDASNEIRHGRMTRERETAIVEHQSRAIRPPSRSSNSPLGAGARSAGCLVRSLSVSAGTVSPERRACLIPTPAGS